MAARKAAFAITNLDSDYEPYAGSKDEDGERYEYRDPVDATIGFLYQPHSIAMLAVLVIGLVVAAFKFTSPTENLSNVFKYIGWLCKTVC